MSVLLQGSTRALLPGRQADGHKEPEEGESAISFIERCKSLMRRKTEQTKTKAEYLSVTIRFREGEDKVHYVGSFPPRQLTFKMAFNNPAHKNLKTRVRPHPGPKSAPAGGELIRDHVRLTLADNAAGD